MPVDDKSEKIKKLNITHDLKVRGTYPLKLIFSTAVSIVAFMQLITYKPYIYTKQPKIARQCTPPLRQRPLVEGGSTEMMELVQMESEIAGTCMVEDDFFLQNSYLVQST